MAAAGIVHNFINNSDHGRDMQMAITLNGYCDALNPTEAGSLNDGSSQNTTSFLGSMTMVAPNELLSAVYPAYWLSPGQVVPTVQPSCTAAPGGIAVNTTAVAPDVMYKRVTVGIGGGDLQKVVKYQSAFTSASARSQAAWQIPTIYLVPEFTVFEKYTGTAWAPMAQGGTDPTATSTTEWVVGSIMVSNTSGSRAIGMWSPTSSMVGARYLPPIATDPTSTISANLFLGQVRAQQTLNAVSYIVVGTRADVQRIMNQSVIGKLF